MKQEMKDRLRPWINVILLAIVFANPRALAIVDMKSASFAQTWTDMEIPSATNQFKLIVERTYSSRSLFDGMFGFGWCSSFETRLDVTPEGNLRLIECGAGQETIFSPQESTRKDIDKTISNVISHLKDSRGMDDRALKALAEDLVSNHRLRAKYATDFKIWVEPKEGVKYFANGREAETLVFQKGQYTRNMLGGTQMRFNKEGRLVQLFDSSGNYVKFEYDKDELREVVDNNSRKLTFKFYNNKKIKSITGPNGVIAEYKFEGLVDLSWVKNQWLNIHQFEYDDEHNLTKAIYPDKTMIQVAYNKEKDWVIRFVDRDKCSEDYTYEMAKLDPKLHYWASLKKICKTEVVNESKYEFIHKKRADGQIYLQRSLATLNGVQSEVIYHEIFGKPLSIRKGSDVTSYEYFANGLVKSKSSRSGKIAFQYDPRNYKVTEVSTSGGLGENGSKRKGTRRSFFSYDHRGNLVVASNSEGLKLNMIYDDHGRIRSIVDQNKKITKIEYEERFGKPSVVTRVGLGTLRVTYRPNGEMDKVASPEGAEVAMKIGGLFNNMLETLSPSSPEVYN